MTATFLNYIIIALIILLMSMGVMLRSVHVRLTKTEARLKRMQNAIDQLHDLESRRMLLALGPQAKSEETAPPSTEAQGDAFISGDVVMLRNKPAPNPA